MFGYKFDKNSYKRILGDDGGFDRLTSNALKDIKKEKEEGRGSKSAIDAYISLFFACAIIVFIFPESLGWILAFFGFFMSVEISERLILRFKFRREAKKLINIKNNLEIFNSLKVIYERGLNIEKNLENGTYSDDEINNKREEWLECTKTNKDFFEVKRIIDYSESPSYSLINIKGYKKYAPGMADNIESSIKQARAIHNSDRQSAYTGMNQYKRRLNRYYGPIAVVAVVVAVVYNHI